MLLTKDSLGKVDKTTGILPIYAKVLDYIKEYKGKEVRANIPYNKTFEFELDLSTPDIAQKVIDKIFKVRKDVTEVTFEGELIEGGALVTATEDDLPDDIKALIAINVFTLEEALAKCTANSGREKRMVIRKPVIKLVEDKEGNKTPVIQKFERKYEEEDLIPDFMYSTEDEDYEDEIDDDTDSDENKSTSNDDNDWLNRL